MKLNLRYFISVVAAAFVFCTTGCKDDKTEDTAAPAVKLTAGETTASSVTFTAVSENAEKTAYVFMEKGREIPSASDILKEGTAVASAQPITISNLKDTTAYVVAAAAQSGSALSAVATIEMKTGAFTENITVVAAGKTTISYHVKADAATRYYHLAVPRDYWNYQLFGLTDPAKIEATKAAILKGLGSVGKGEKTYTRVDGGKDEDGYLVQVLANSDYLLVKADCDAAGKITGALDTVSFKTAVNELSTATVSTEVSKIMSTSVTIRCVPDAALNHFYVYPFVAAEADAFIKKYGEDSWKRVLMFATSPFESTVEGKIGSLTANTAYTLYAAGVDDQANFTSLIATPFMTKDNVEPTVKLTYTLEDDGEGHTPYNSINFNIKTTDAEMIQYFVAPTEEIETYREKYTDDVIVRALGDTLENRYTDIANTAAGLQFQYSGLRAGTSYTIILAAFNNKYLKVDALDAKTKAYDPVESVLFDKLPGKWTATVNGMRGEDKNYRPYTFDVTIAAGVNEATSEDYRGANQLVCLGFTDFKYYGPEYLVENGFPADEANRAYGPKWFLNIAKGDVVTVPTDMDRTFYSWSQAGDIYLISANLTEGKVGPDALPVEVSADYNTIKVNPATASGVTYYPAVAYAGQSGMQVVFDSNSGITMTRVKESGAIEQNLPRLNTADRNDPAQQIRKPGSGKLVKKPLLENGRKVRIGELESNETGLGEIYKAPKMKFFGEMSSANTEFRVVR